MNTTIFAIDLGNKRVKMKSGRAEYVYPASYLNAENIATGGLGGQAVEGNQMYQLPSDEDNTFVWGENLEAYNIPEKMIDTYTRTGRYTQKKAKRLLEFAIARLALDYPEAAEKGLKVHLILGVPTSDAHEQSKTLQLLKELALLKHRVIINGVEVLVEVPNAEHVTILPQYMGSAINAAYDDTLHTVPKYKDGRIGIIDIGGGTILVNVMNQMSPAPVGEERFEGVQVLIKEIATKINVTKPFLIENLLREGNASGHYIYRPNRNERDARDVTREVVREIDNYTRFMIAPLITEAFPDFETLDFVLVTGGGANIISKDALKDEIGDYHFERLVFVEDSEKANVRGFYKAVQLLDAPELPSVADVAAPIAPVATPKREETPQKEVNLSSSQSVDLAQLLSNVEKLNEKMSALYAQTEKAEKELKEFNGK